MERDRNFRERGFFTANVIGVFTHIGRVMHLTGGGEVSNHAFADFQAVAGAVEFAAGAAVGTYQQQFAALLIVQVDVGIQASEGASDLVDDLIQIGRASCRE